MNIVLITADSLRPDFLGCYAGARAPARTPFLDAFGSRAALFSSAFTQGPYTTLAMPALMTGRYPCRLRPVTRSLPSWEVEGVVVSGSTTLPQVLQGNGMATAAFHSNTWLTRLFGFEQGFDHFFDDHWLGTHGVPDRLRLALAQLRRVIRTEPFMSARGIRLRAQRWIAETKQPFFALLHFMDTHGPYVGRKFLKLTSPAERAWRIANSSPDKMTPAIHARLLRNYCRQVEYLDREVGAFLAWLDAHYPLQDTVVIFTADHGEQFGEHGDYSHHGHLYEEHIHVPLLIRAPATPARRLEGLVETIQIPPTVLQLAGMPPQDSFERGGLAAVLRGGEDHGLPVVLAEVGRGGHDLLAARNARWKLIRSGDGSGRELYNLIQDPGERVNQVEAEPQVAAELEAFLLQHLGATPAHAAAEMPPADPLMNDAEGRLVEERLRDLGYI